MPTDEKQRMAGVRKPAEGMAQRRRVADDVTGRCMLMERVIVEGVGKEDLDVEKADNSCELGVL